MSTLTWILVESRASLAAILGLVLFFLLVLWRRGGSVRPLLVGLGASAALLYVQFAVVTQRERAAAALDAIAKDFEHGRTTTLTETLAAEFAAGELRGETMDRARFIAYVGDLLTRIDVVGVMRVDLDITDSSSDGFRAEAGFIAEVATGEARGAFRSRWSLTFARKNDGWKISAIEPVSIEGIPTPTWERIAREQ